MLDIGTLPALCTPTSQKAKDHGLTSCGSHGVTAGYGPGCHFVLSNGGPYNKDPYYLVYYLRVPCEEPQAKAK